MLMLELDPDLERMLSSLARRQGKSETDFARELLESFLEDLEDVRLAEASLREGGPNVTAEQARKALGLDD